MVAGVVVVTTGSLSFEAKKLEFFLKMLKFFPRALEIFQSTGALKIWSQIFDKTAVFCRNIVTNHTAPWKFFKFFGGLHCI